MMLKIVSFTSALVFAPRVRATASLWSAGHSASATEVGGLKSLGNATPTLALFAEFGLVAATSGVKVRSKQNFESSGPAPGGLRSGWTTLITPLECGGGLVMGVAVTPTA